MLSESLVDQIENNPELSEERRNQLYPMYEMIQAEKHSQDAYNPGPEDYQEDELNIESVQCNNNGELVVTESITKPTARVEIDITPDEKLDDMSLCFEGIKLAHDLTDGDGYGGRWSARINRNRTKIIVTRLNFRFTKEPRK